MTTTDDIYQHADQVTAMVDADIHAGKVPAAVASFADLHEHVDANQYALRAGVPWTEGPYGWDLVNRVEGIVSRRLASRKVPMPADPGHPQWCCPTCGSSCPRTGCIDHLRRRPYEAHEGHRGDEGTED